jgi:hypothetical protein
MCLPSHKDVVIECLVFQPLPSHGCRAWREGSIVIRKSPPVKLVIKQ